MKSRKKFVVGVSVMLVLALLLTGYVIWFNKDADRRTAQVVAIADQFKAPADWTATANSTNRPTITGCIDIVCPSVHRNWSFGPKEPSDLESILNSLKKIGWVFGESRGCELDRIVSDKSSICYLKGDNSGLSVTFTIHVENRMLTGATLLVE